MNCKPGDIAVVIRTDNLRNSHHLGMIVEVLSAAPHGIGTKFTRPDGVLGIRSTAGSAWFCKKAYPTRSITTGQINAHSVFPDANLKRLDDPDKGIDVEERELAVASDAGEPK